MHHKAYLQVPHKCWSGGNSKLRHLWRGCVSLVLWGVLGVVTGYTGGRGRSSSGVRGTIRGQCASMGSLGGTGHNPSAPPDLRLGFRNARVRDCLFWWLVNSWYSGRLSRICRPSFLKLGVGQICAHISHGIGPL